MAPGKKNPTVPPKRFGSFWLPFIIPLLILILWQVLGDRGILRPSLLPPPSAVGQALIQSIQSGDLARNMGVSLQRVLEGFTLGSGLGILLGFILGFFNRMERASFFLIGFLRPIPTIAWIPALILWLGIDEASKVTVIAIGSFWPVLLGALQGVRGVDPRYLEVARVLEKDRWTLVSRIVLPSALPSLFTGLRVAMGIAWASVVGAELIAASSGIGYMIMYAREVSQPDVMLAGVAVIGLIGLVIDFLFLAVERRLSRWAPPAFPGRKI